MWRQIFVTLFMFWANMLCLFCYCYLEHRVSSKWINFIRCDRAASALQPGVQQRLVAPVRLLRRRLVRGLGERRGGQAGARSDAARARAALTRATPAPAPRRARLAGSQKPYRRRDTTWSNSQYLALMSLTPLSRLTCHEDYTHPGYIVSRSALSTFYE